SLHNAFREAGLDTPVASIITQVVVDRADPAFLHPTKPIGSFYMEAAAEAIMRENPQWTFREDAGRGWRRVVPSPLPVKIAEIKSIRRLLDCGTAVIACGGGGIPVCQQENATYHAVSAVIDKDFAAAAMAEAVHADLLVILTAVPHAYLHYGTPQQTAIAGMSVEEAERYIGDGAFAAGSMLPKVQAAVAFAKTGRRAVIAALDDVEAALTGNAGTMICP
ncbi:MAG: carbamate kinase, partial [Eubacteriales bacterium]|nr:carbamate kinase [Eubacteriales bacterium]